MNDALVLAEAWWVGSVQKHGWAADIDRLLVEELADIGVRECPASVGAVRGR